MVEVSNTFEPPVSLGAAVRAPDRAAILEEMAGIVDASPLITLATVTSHGWPSTACMHFGLHRDGPRPIIYMMTHDGTRKLANIAADPRVALAVFSYGEGGAERLAVHLQGLCSEVRSPSEHALAMREHSRRPGYEFTRYISMQYQPALRVEVVRGTVFRPDGALDVDFPAAVTQTEGS